MKSMKYLRGGLTALAMVGMMLPRFGLATESVPENTKPAISIIDVALHQDGTLRGQVLDVQGIPAAETTVAVVHQGEVVATVRTDRQGRYSVDGLKTGLYQVVTDQGITVCRVWNAKVAPPSAQTEALVIDGTHVMRGHLGGRSLGALLSNPWVLGAIVAAAIAIPLALDDKKSGS
jgi:hypothetical protein